MNLERDPSRRRRVDVKPSTPPDLRLLDTLDAVREDYTSSVGSVLSMAHSGGERRLTPGLEEIVSVAAPRSDSAIVIDPVGSS